MNKKRERINFPAELIEQLIARELDAAKNKKWIEALSLQMFMVETTLRFLIRSEIFLRLGVKSAEEHAAYGNYWNDEKFARLASNYLLLGGDKALVDSLLAYSKRRGKVIHEMDIFGGLDALDRHAQETYKTGDGLFKTLIDALDPINERLEALKHKAS